MKFLRILAVPALLLISHGSAFACAACYNSAGNEKMNNAATIGIFAMVAIMFVMLGTLFAFGVYFARRAKQTFPDYDELLSDDAAPASGPNP